MRQEKIMLTTTRLPRFALLLASIALCLPTAGQTAAQGGWERLGDGDGPAPRSEHTLAADAEGNGLVLFGGRDDGGTALGDTWRFDAEASSWRAIAGAGPAPRFGHAVAVDADAGVFYLYGGQVGSTFFDDTWRYEFATDTWVQLETTAPPAPRYGHSAVLTGNGQVVISHGFTFEGRFDDTWSLNPDSGNWTDISPDAGAARPLPRCLHEAIWDTVSDRMLLFGGCASGYGPCPLGDLWSFDLSTRSWSEVTPATGPSPRTNPALVYDEANRRAILLAGSSDTGFQSDAWSIDLNEEVLIWTEQQASDSTPAARGSHDAAVLNGVAYVFGGVGDTGKLADLWRTELETD